MRASMNFLSRAASRLVIATLLLLVTSVSASAETLMMPKRDARMGVPVVVWGVHTQAGSPACTLDFGDATPVANCTGMDRSYTAFTHTYATQGTFTATLTVGSEVATVAVRVFDVSLLPGGAAGDANRGLGINMAIEDGLRYLWTSQSSRAANFPAAVTTNWGNGYVEAEAALIVLAFENHGYSLSGNVAPTGLYEKYVVRRGLNYVMSWLGSITLNGQPAGNPCVGGLGVAAGDCGGLTTSRGDHRGYIGAVVMLPFAASGALTRINTEVGGATAGMTFGQILQRLTNTQVWGMTDSGEGRGGIGYNHNGGQFDGSTVGWGVLAFLDAEAAGATLPAFARTEFAFGLNYALNTDGSFDYNVWSGGSSSDGPHKAGIGLQGLFFINDSGPRVALVKANINSWWNGPTGGIGANGWGCGGIPGIPYPNDTNKGCAYSMFNNFKGLKLAGIATLPGVTRPAGPGTQPAGDWYADYQDWLVSNQPAPNTLGGGGWGSVMGFSCCYSGDSIETAIAELILSPVALVLPDAEKFGAFGLSPATNTALELTTHTVTAKAESTGGTPVPGATVNFLILTGPNAGLTGTDTTDSNGEATFTYTDAGPVGTVGTDTIQASIGSLTSNIVKMIWKPLNSPPVAVDDSETVNEDTTLSASVATNDSDPDPDTLTFTATSTTANGTLVFAADGSYTYSPNANYCGVDGFTYTVDDGHGESDSATVTITVNCVNDAPVCTITPSQASIWPPNHKMVSITASGATDVDSAVLTYSVVSIFQDEPTNTTGDGNTAIDGAGIGTSTAQVRAERTGDPKNPGNGRVYHITFSVSDGELSCTSTVQVGVPHDQSGKVQPIDGGALFDSTVAGPPPAATTTAKGKGN